MKNLIEKHAEKLRFGVVGIISTTIDFFILFTLVAVGLPAIASNFISTSVAMVFSFFTNKSYTFRVNDRTKKHFVYFVLITVFGLWIIQPIIIYIVDLMLGSWFTESCLVSLVGDLLGTWFKPLYLALFIGKSLATAASLVWNYLMYRKFVFNKQT